MDLTVNQGIPGCADGNYHIKAKGCIAASLHWADENGALPDWQSFAYLPIETNGVGTYKMAGGRAVPKDATHVLARAVSADFSSAEEILAPIPKLAERDIEEPVQRFLVMTDLHLCNKPWQVRKALSMGRGYDAVLITGDCENCFGRGESFGRRCTSCYGSGTCRRCNGQEEFTCSYCRGSGECSLCQGESWCPDCGGTGMAG